MSSLSSIRVTMILASLMLWLSYWLSGFANLHWLAYVPAVMLMVAGVIGFCPSTWLLGKIGFKPTDIKK